MTDDLLTEAKHLAERGWLPGIYVAVGATTVGNTMNVAPRLYCEDHPQDPTTEADLHLAATKEIDNRGWIAVRNRKFMYIAILTGGTEFEKKGSWFRFEEHGTTTLSLLRCLRAACEEHERNEGAKR